MARHRIKTKVANYQATCCGFVHDYQQSLFEYGKKTPQADSFLI